MQNCLLEGKDRSSYFPGECMYVKACRESKKFDSSAFGKEEMEMESLTAWFVVILAKVDRVGIRNSLAHTFIANPPKTRAGMVTLIHFEQRLSGCEECFK